jgi:tetratricopeptide (TPR) repeat protein
MGWSFFDPFHENVEEGNEKAQDQEAAAALQRYEEARRVKPASPIPDFNRGIVLSRDGKTEEAGDAFLAAAASDAPAIAADALYNHGNTLLDAEQFAPAIDAYLKSLDLDPADADARRNLEIAARRLEQQQQQQQQQQQNQNQDDGENEEREPQPQDEGQNEEQQPNDPSQQEEPSEPPQPQGPPEERLSREDAERLLNAVESEELKVLQQLLEQEQETKGVALDW